MILHSRYALAFNPARRAGLVLAGLLLTAFTGGSTTPTPSPTDATATAPPRVVALQECLLAVLSKNREIQIERFQPRLAHWEAESAASAYDPILFNDTRWESLADNGGFDPADFSRDAVYRADSEVSRLGISGLGPLGLSYTLGADYAHSTGLRNGFDFDAYSLRLNATARQPLLRNLWIDRARHSLRISQSRLQSSRLLLRHRVQDVLHRTAAAYHEWAHAHEVARIQSTLLTHRETLALQVDRLVEGGKLTASDALLARAETAVAAARHAEAHQAATLARHALLTLVGHEWTGGTDAPWIPEVEAPAAPSPDDLEHARLSAAALARRDDLAYLRQEAQRARLDVRFWRNQLLPSLDLVGTYGRRGASTAQVVPPFQFDASFAQAWDQVEHGDAPNSGIGFIFTLPLSRKLERSQYRASHELRALAELRIRQLEEAVQREVADAQARLAAARWRTDLTRTARQLAAETLAAEERRLAAGSSTVFLLVQLQSSLTGARLAEDRARTDERLARNALDYATGSLLESHGLAWEESAP